VSGGEGQMGIKHSLDCVRNPPPPQFQGKGGGIGRYEKFATEEVIYY